MPIVVNVTIKGDTETIKRITKLGDSLGNFTLAMKSIGKEVSSFYANQVLASQGGIIGKKWSPLSTGYALRKSVKYPGRGPLIATGTMERSFTYAPTMKSVTITNTAPYFKYHQSSAPRTKMPYRPMMAIDNDVKNIVQQIVQKDISDKLKMAGL